MKKSRIPFLVGVLVALLVVLGIGGFYGGISFLIDPLQKRTMNVPLSILDGLFVRDFTLPGLFLFIVMGIIPILLAFGLIFRPVWKWTEVLTGWSKRHWSWAGSLILSILLILWLGLEIIVMKSGMLYPPQIATGVLGFVLLLVTLLPPVSNFYRKQD
jgi:hypothetical protein